MIKIDPSTPIPTWGIPLSKENQTDHWLYRFFNSSGELLYVGITSDPHMRFSTHRRVKPWFSKEVEACSVEMYPDRESAFTAENLAIRSESPIYNIAGIDDLNDEQEISEAKAERVVIARQARLLGASNYLMAKVVQRAQTTVAAWLK